MQLSEIESRLERVLSAEWKRLPPEQVAEMRELVRAGEPGIALENLCSQLHEYNVAVSAALVLELTELANAMGIDAKYVSRLPISQQK
jgi:hypothetical protein